MKGFPGHRWGHQESVRLPRKSAKDRVLGHTHPHLKGGSRTRCEEKQERVPSVEARGSVRREWVAVENTLKAQAG